MHLFMILHFNNITQHDERQYSKLQQIHLPFIPSSMPTFSSSSYLAANRCSSKSLLTHTTWFIYLYETKDVMALQITMQHVGNWSIHQQLEALGQCIPLPRHALQVLRYGSGFVSGLPPKFNHLFTGPLPNFPEHFMQIHLEVFAWNW